MGHDEYWSGPMRANVEAARDQSVNLGFFAANVCFWQVQFEAGERVFSVDKNNENGQWRRAVINNPEISMIGVEYAYNSLDKNMKMPNPLPSGSGVGGFHWAYDYSGLTNGQVLIGLLGYEVDGCIIGTICNCSGSVCPDTNTTVILADSPFDCGGGCGDGTGRSYMTLYTNSSGARVFATGSMQWNWGLDSYGSQIIPGGPRIQPAAQQMTHNVLRTFSGKGRAPVVLTNVDTVTGGDWTNRYGTNGYWIADTSLITNLPSFAQVTLSNQTAQVWTNLSSDPRALLLPNSTNHIASAWTTAGTQGSAFTINLNLTDTNLHQIALYCTDWLGTGTVLEKVEVFETSDTSFLNPLDTRSFQLPPNGVYLVWYFTGSKAIRITKLDAVTGNKAMVSGLFFGTGT